MDKKHQSKVRLGVNIDHIATLRNARGGTHPDPASAAAVLRAAGADGVTVHLREDRRHIRDDDVRRLREENILPINLEMAATEEMLAIARAIRPHACCIVPERRAELTTEGGLDAAGCEKELRPFVARLREGGVRVSLFIGPELRQVEAAARIGADAVELHTGRYCALHDASQLWAEEREALRAAAAAARALGLECHAGHGLNFANVRPIAAIPEVVEVNIGHFLIGQALFDGLESAVRAMRRILNEARAS